MYSVAPLHWRPSDPNPFSNDGSYGSDWSCFYIDGVDRRVNFCGGGRTGPFTFRLGADAPSLATSLADFLRYEHEHDRQVIVCSTEPIDVDDFVRQTLRDTLAATVVRPSDPKWVVHSTTPEGWTGIKKGGCVKSLSTLQMEGKKITGLGLDELGEPPDYAEYIVLGRVDEMNAEHVVSSRQKGHIVTDPDLPYQPGARLYFDNHMIIQAGLAMRDGLHLAKVRGVLPLTPYMVVSVSVEELPVETWTPRTFWKAANDLFLQKTGVEM